ncbi:unnamed protein product [Heligmosomoides polygyrus]|uniref:Uncharacterized protein n=1 Tax=Heligmosomoides polygyrus TaxID=6339 RepID=A0A183FWS0_HELPZ|nr:unnamed protein product [Heligmosomoides polygyrus]
MPPIVCSEGEVVATTHTSPDETAMYFLRWPPGSVCSLTKFTNAWSRLFWETENDSTKSLRFAPAKWKSWERSHGGGSLKWSRVACVSSRTDFGKALNA